MSAFRCVRVGRREEKAWVIEMRRSVRSCVEGGVEVFEVFECRGIVEIGAWLLGYYSNGARGAQAMRDYRMRDVMVLSGGTRGRASWL